jgi:hypothetical protein
MTALRAAQSNLQWFFRPGKPRHLGRRRDKQALCGRMIGAYIGTQVVPPHLTCQDCVNCAAVLRLPVPGKEKLMTKLVWKEGGHLSDPDAGYALCGAPVRFQGEREAVMEAEACRACLLRAEGGSREFVAPMRQREGGGTSRGLI